MAANSIQHSGRINNRNADNYKTVSSSCLSDGRKDDKPHDKIGISAEKAFTERTENRLSRLAEDIFGSSVDTDKLLVAALMLLLLKEGADPKLILALGYILI